MIYQYNRHKELEATYKDIETASKMTGNTVYQITACINRRRGIIKGYVFTNKELSQKYSKPKRQ
jgi:hypothetical protein